jgi:hypothetical protein
VKWVVMKLNAMIGPEKKTHEVAGRFHGDDSGSPVMTEEQGCVFDFENMHSVSSVLCRETTKLRSRLAAPSDFT